MRLQSSRVHSETVAMSSRPSRGANLNHIGRCRNRIGIPVRGDMECYFTGKSDLRSCFLCASFPEDHSKGSDQAESHCDAGGFGYNQQ